MKQKRNARKFIVGLLTLSLLGTGGISQAADQTSSQSGKTAPGGEAASKDGACCKPGDTTPPPELVAKTPKGKLKNPYQDFAKVAEDGHHQFMRPGCNECHGGTGGGGICPPLDQGVWFWGSDDDTLFRLVTLGSQELQKEGYQRLGEGTVKGPMPAMGTTIQTSDDLWKIIAWIRSINPPPRPPLSSPPNE
jgi:mono/diheme cytochrome c family protein